MVSDQGKILAWFQRHHFQTGETQFEQCLEIAVIEALGKTGLDAKQYVAANQIRLWNYINAENSRCVARGLLPIFSSCDKIERKLIFPPRIQVRTKKKRYIVGNIADRPHLLRKIDFFDHREYEALGCYASTICGADRYMLTPPGNEGGIDFFSRIRNYSKNHIFSGSYAPMRIIGQSKKYKDKVTLGKIRDFKTAIDQVKFRNGKGGDLVPDWFSSMHGPIIGWMIAHSGFQSGVVDFAKDQGILLSTSIDLAEILCFSKAFLPNIGSRERCEFLSSQVLKILEVNSL